MNDLILSAISSNARAIGQARSVPVAYPGVDFTPPDSGLWMELLVFWNGSQDYAVGRVAVGRGFFRLMVCTRPGAGLVPVTQLSEAIIAYFPKGTLLGPARTDSTPSTGGPIITSDKLIIPVTVQFRSTRN